MAQKSRKLWEIKENRDIRIWMDHSRECAILDIGKKCWGRI
jgi:hypothetical protein